MARKIIGTATTDSNGVAVLSDGYTGTGAGLVDFGAETTIDSSTVVSQPYTVWDTLMYDNTYTSSKWTLGSSITEEDGDGYAIFKSSGSNSSTGKSATVSTFSGDIEVIFEVNITYSGAWGVYFGLKNGSNESFVQLKVSGWRYIKFRRVSGVCTCYISSDGTNWEQMTIDSDNVGDTSASFIVFIYSGAVTDPRTVQFKNLKIYKL